MRFILWLRDLFGDLFVNLFGQSQATQDPAFDNEAYNAVGIDPFNPFPEPVKIEITDVINLHTIQPRDVKRVVEEYLMQAHNAGFRTVRIIHGKGIGVQRGIVQAILSATPQVENWTDAPLEGGGWGATIVRLSQTRQQSTDYPDDTD